MNKYFSDIHPGKGTIKFAHDTRKERINKKAEFEEAKRLLVELGGDILILRESRQQGISTPDISRNNTEFIEIKHPNSLVAVDTRLRQGINQLLVEKNHLKNATLKVLILILGKKIRHTSHRTIEAIIRKRVKEVWKCEVDLIIVRNGNTKFEIKL